MILLQFIGVLIVLALIAVNTAQKDIADQQVAAAHAWGGRLAEVAGAAGMWVEDNKAALVNGVHINHRDLLWLKDASCHGAAARPYLPCEFPEWLPFDQVYKIEITRASDVIDVDVSLTTPIKIDEKTRGDLQGVYVTAAAAGKRGGLSVAQHFYRDSNRVIHATVSTTNPADLWLNVDGSDQMLADLDLGGNDIVNAHSMTAKGNLEAEHVKARTAMIAPVYRDTDADFYLNPNDRSRLSALDVASLRLRNVSVPGNRCYRTTDTIGTTSTGELMSCVEDISLPGTQTWEAVSQPRLVVSGQWIRRGGRGSLNLGTQGFCAITHYRSDSQDDGTCFVRRERTGHWIFTWSQQRHVHCGVTCFNFN